MKRLSFAGFSALGIVLILSLSSFAFPVPDTGQTKCYNNTVEITCPQPGEPFYGQDANYTINQPSYTDLGNGIVRDNVTGLMWQKSTTSNITSYTWDQAITYCENLTLGGYSDWRLPTIKELSTLVDSSRVSPAINTTYFPDTQQLTSFWSSTPGAGYTGAESFAWGVYFGGGIVDSGDKTGKLYVRAVRGVLASNNFIDNNDGTVTDTSTGLMWQQNGSTQKTWGDALAYCESLTLAGHSDWRLPNRNELQTIVDYSRYNPAIDTAFFPDTAAYYYWSSTTYTDLPVNAWYVHFGIGIVRLEGYGKDWLQYVRAVRGGQVDDNSTTTTTASTQPPTTTTTASPMSTTTTTLPSGPTPVPDTGQTKCYNNTVEITCPQPGEPFYGQDANYTINQPSYTDLGNGIVRDNVTGLEWQQATVPDTYMWQQALNYVASMNSGSGTYGFTDWRLPTIKELSTLVDSSIPSPGPTINTSFSPDTVASVYWSSTTHAADTYPGGLAWYVDFSNGGVEANFNKAYSFHVRAVRGVLAANNFIDNNDGTVTDTSTGLMWQKATASNTANYTWEQALTYCENLTLGGYSDWRLPNRNELQTIVDYSRYMPAINTTFFPGTLYNYYPFYYWSSTTDAYYTDYAWGVSFFNGAIYGDGLNYTIKSGTLFVRAVRDGQLVENSTTTTTELPISTTTTTTPSGQPCPAKTALGEQARELQPLRAFRDRVMKRSNQGRKYVELYYQHASEISSLLEAQPKLKGEVQRLILKLLPTVQALLAQNKGSVEAGTVTQATAILDNLSSLGSPSLSADLVQLKKEMQSGKLFEGLNISVAGEGIHPRLK